jgi:tetratricopeptide (TPR) repeat protein
MVADGTLIADRIPQGVSMRTALLAWFFVFASAAVAEPEVKMNSGLHLKAGDVITQRQESGEWAVVKVLLIDVWPDSTESAHCRTYVSTASRPELAAVRNLKVLLRHAPIAAASFREGWELLGNQKVEREEFDGFIVYLKNTDFSRYLEFTGQDSKKVVAEAGEHYRRGYALGEQKKRIEAIEEYGKAIDLFPLFYEAIDNRAFTYMELGRWRDALSDFEESLRVEPDGYTAFFSRGECLLRLREFAAAEKQFSEGITKFPEHAADFERFRKFAHDKAAAF